MSSGASRRNEGRAAAPASRAAAPRRGARSHRTGLDSRLRAWSRHHRAMARDSAHRLLRRPLGSLLTMVAIAIALILPCALWLVMDSAKALDTELDESATLTVYLSASLGEHQAMDVADTLRAQPGVAGARLVTAAEGMAEFQQALGLEDALSELEENPLPASIIVSPRDVSPQAVNELSGQLDDVEGVDEVRLDMAWLERLNRLAELGQRLTLALGVLFGLGVLLIVGNTIRLAVESRRQEIEVVTLIGATHAFVRRPFLYSGAWYGLGGGLLAWGMLTLGGQWLAAPVQALAQSYGATFVMPSLGTEGSAILLVSSTLLGWLGSWIAVSRHLKDIRPR
ncbi:permease-like cell division protein FtsX [Halomonas sp. McH1-25]|uniref:permease-like cell division protein FtsX n=1 Tax=unclassified Halomonas TaxID=2609666 RepID=UPI001EF63C2D|nr:MULTISPECIES: permease-like cell division protein FtsX [unclassified Halomonas]MCG7601680.1 permease-like cell division protein FtsX [Halomonas sp. McH1-25]MCP1342199.1 permease-like cell division protein FtsX [Halomonas sp. FL8]MCP1362816.1 permease-like cell division protein FtsX [Halomonas sp. BBD45]MCP1365150.1 permease-like cell division protein FtsX [Halomonas sp. BBD48]